MGRWIAVGTVLAALVACSSPEDSSTVAVPDDGTGGPLAPRPVARTPVEPPPPPPPPPPPGGPLLKDPDAPFVLPPLQTDLPHYELEAAPSALAALAANPRDNVMYPATFTHDGVSHQVMIRYRGNSSRSWPKKSWRIEFPKERMFDGRHKLNLLSEWRDQTMMVEKLGYDLLAAMGAVASRAKYVRLTINGVHQGVYLDLERVDNNFLRNHGFADQDGTIYRCGRKDCEMKLWTAGFQSEWEKETNEVKEPGFDDLQAFLRTIHTLPEPELPQALEQHLELEIYLRMMVADALISNDTIEDSRSYLIHDRVTGRWHYAPWDLNNSTTKYQPGSDPGKQADHDQPLFVYTATNTWSQLEYEKRKSADGAKDWHALFSDLSTRIQFHPELRVRLLDRLEQALDTLFTPEIIGARVDAMYALIAPHMVGDPHVEPALFADAPRYMKDFVAMRTEFLRAELAKYRAAQPGVLLDVVDPGADRIVLRNHGAAPVSLAGWVLTANLRRRPVANLPARTLDPGQSLELSGAAFGLVAGGIGEVGLWSGPAVHDVVDLLYYGPMATGEYLARDPADPGRWILAR